MNPRYFARLNRKNQTPAEKIFWTKVRNRKFDSFKFQRQFLINYFIFNGQKSFFLVDFYCHQFKTIIEIDGPIHNAQQEYDQERTAILEEMGYKVIRFTNEEVMDNWEFVEKTLRGSFGV